MSAIKDSKTSILNKYTNQQLVQFYSNLLLPRLIEERMLILLRQGKISKWFSSWGQEAISVGLTIALQADDYIFPMHRNLGVFTTRKLPLQKLFAQLLGKQSGYTKGRDRSFHFGTKEHSIVGMISHLAAQLGVANGIALGNILDKNDRVTLAITGDGGASEGDFHEALNVASVWNLPIIFGIENNAWGLSTPSKEQFNCEQFIDKGIGYGMKAVQVDGNNLLEVIATVQQLAKEIKENPQPIILEFMTYRIRGHEESSGTKYYPKGIQEEWAKKDPITLFENVLLQNNCIDSTQIENIKLTLNKEIRAAEKLAFAEKEIKLSILEEERDVFALTDAKIIEPSEGKQKDIRFIDAISDGLREAMNKYPNLILIGQDIAEFGGVFKITEGFVEKYGKDRVRNSPICESAILGSSLGLSIQGKKTMVELQFSDFVTCGFNQIVNNLATAHYRWGQHADVVLRMPTGAGMAAGPFHSQSTEAWFFHTPGLKIVYPAFPEDAKGLLLSAFKDPNPVLFFEHKKLYRSLKSDVPKGYYETPLGKALTVKEGNDLSIVTYGLGVHWALEFSEQNPHLSIDIVDLRSLAPLDYEHIYRSIRKTNRVIVLHEDNLTGGIGAEITARIADECFEYLDAPVKRVASLDTPIPFNAELENQYLPVKKLAEVVHYILKY